MGGGRTQGGGDAALPPELLPRVLGHVPVVDYFAAVAATCRQFSALWYLGLFPQTVIVPDDAPCINAAINRLGVDGDGASYGLVLVRPGVYAESVRVTRNCYLMGLGGRGDVVVEAPGWESALVFAGLGVRGFGSGEDARVINITFRCRNEHMRGRCLYIVMGQPRLEQCDVDGGVVVGGLCTAPQICRCRIRKSRGSGLHLTDHCRGIVEGNAISGHKRNGILIDRRSCPVVVRNRIVDNGTYGVHIFQGLDHDSQPWDHAKVVKDNVMQGNQAGELVCSPLFVDNEENVLDFDTDDSPDSEPGG